MERQPKDFEFYRIYLVRDKGPTVSISLAQGELVLTDYRQMDTLEEFNDVINSSPLGYYHSFRIEDAKGTTHVSIFDPNIKAVVKS
jgi:hypothetical protein